MVSEWALTRPRAHRKPGGCRAEMAAAFERFIIHNQRRGKFEKFRTQLPLKAANPRLMRWIVAVL